MWTIKDRAWRDAHEQMVTSIPDAVLAVAQESDHLIPEKQPEIIAEAAKQVIRLVESIQAQKALALGHRVCYTQPGNILEEVADGKRSPCSSEPNPQQEA